MKIKQLIKNKTDFYLIFLELITASKNFNITKNDIKVLAALYNKHDEFFNRLVKSSKSLDEIKQEIGKYILSTEIRKEFAKDIKISVQSFNNSISKLRKEGMIVGNILFYFGATLHSYMYSHNNFELNIEFNVHISE